MQQTGRQHQIRIHLSELGHPVLGDRVYARYRDDMPPAPRVMLHARTLGFVHPTRDNGEVMHYEAAIPEDMMAVARRLGIDEKLPNDASLALGTGEVTLLELTAAYAPFFNGGRLVTPYGLDLGTRPPPQQVIQPEMAAMMES